MENIQINPSSLDTILCQVQTDQQFIHDIRQIADKKQSATKRSFFEQKDQYALDNQMLQQIHLKALWHTEANMVNKNNIDIAHEQQGDNMNCQCGCNKQKGQLLSIFSLEQRIASLGSGIIFVFFYLKHMRLLIVISALSFGLFGFLTNFNGISDPYQVCKHRSSISLAYCQFNEASSFRSVHKIDTIVAYQNVFGLIMILVWIMGIKIIGGLGEIKNKQINNLMDSSADSTIIIKNLPASQFEQGDLKQYLKSLWEQYESSNEQITGSMPRIKSIQIIYNMQKCRNKIDEITSLAISMVDCFEKKKYRNSNEINKERIDQYRNNKKKFISVLRQLENMRRQFLYNPNFRRQISTTLALIEFCNKQDQQTFLSALQSVSNPIQNALSPKYNLQFKGCMPSITRSPQPSDILWLNCQKKQNYFRIVAIWVVTMVILYSGYALVSYIQTLQVLKQLDHVLSTIVLQLLNRLIWFWLSIVVTYEQNNTKTDNIISSMKKSIIAQTINIIVNPILAIFVNQKGLYGVNGLSGMALTYQIIMLGMMFLYNIFNPFYLLKKMILSLGCLRNILIKSHCKLKNHTYNYDQIRPVLTFYEGPEFPIAGSYVYMTTALFHAMFYCHLQPTILLLLFLNMTVFLYIMKYMLYKRCKYPQLTNSQIFQLAIFLANCAAAYYGVGSIFFYIIDEQNKNKHFAHIIPSVICLIVWFISNIWISDKCTQFAKQIIKVVKKAIKRPKKRGNDQEPNNIISKNNKSVVQNSMENYSLTIYSQQLNFRRRQSYYTDANTNSLLQFESILRPTRSDGCFKGKKLKDFCESGCNIDKKTSKSRFNCQAESFVSKKQQISQLRIKNSEDYKQNRKNILIPAIKLRQQPTEKSVKFRTNCKIFLDQLRSEQEKINS